MAVFLIHSFLFEQVSFAAPDLKPLAFDWADQNHKAWARKILPPVSESIATLEDAWHGKGDKTLILIQDAHTNNSGQLNTARLLDILLSSRSSSRDQVDSSASLGMTSGASLGMTSGASLGMTSGASLGMTSGASLGMTSGASLGMT
ncbi:MAG: hypothetical protein HY592_00775, partial [Candidatus Omnitrophica bacterium]|nr:hypothetical protein [Candidatus Omnitrophota bacterium]